MCSSIFTAVSPEISSMPFLPNPRATTMPCMAHIVRRTAAGASLALWLGPLRSVADLKLQLWQNIAQLASDLRFLPDLARDRKTPFELLLGSRKLGPKTTIRSLFEAADTLVLTVETGARPIDDAEFTFPPPRSSVELQCSIPKLSIELEAPSSLSSNAPPTSHPSQLCHLCPGSTELVRDVKLSALVQHAARRTRGRDLVAQALLADAMVLELDGLPLCGKTPCADLQ